MISVERLFENWFDDKNFSTAELLDYGQDHLSRLTTNDDGGALAQVIAETDTALTAAGSTTTSEETARAVQKSRTKAKTDHLKLITQTVSQQSGLVSATFSKGSPEWLEFFPQGLDEFHHLREAEVETKLNRLVTAAHAHVPALEPVFAGLLTTWLAVYGKAAEQRGKSDGAGDAQAGAVEALRLQFMKNALTLALRFLADGEKAAVYFDESRLYNAQSAKKAAPAPAPAA
jgi:hypothetical protein